LACPTGPFRGGSRRPSGVEIVGACDRPETWFPNLIATAAFCVLNSGWTCEPGAVFPGVVAAHRPDTTVPHPMFVEPFLWKEQLTPREIGDRTVAWLLAVPISPSERDFAQRHSADALEERFERAEVDIFDLDRQPAV